MSYIKDKSKNNKLNCTGNYSAISMYRKLEKIVMAVYMVTDFFPNEEPLKFYLRDRCIQLMSFVMSLTNDPSSVSKKSFFEITALMSEIDSALRIALNANLISDMNYSILGNEYNFFLDLINKCKDEGIGRKVLFADDFFFGDKLSSNKDKERSFGHLNNGEFTKGHNSTKGHIADISKGVRHQKAKNKLKRTDLIIDIIKDKKEVSVKDIVKIIKGCSEKTVQRDLAFLVENNFLKRKGERRWCRYSLV